MHACVQCTCASVLMYNCVCAYRCMLEGILMSYLIFLKIEKGLPIRNAAYSDDCMSFVVIVDIHI